MVTVLIVPLNDTYISCIKKKKQYLYRSDEPNDVVRALKESSQSNLVTG